MAKQKITGRTIGRDVSWIYFNHRILQEARRRETPLLERLTFLGIYSNNLDEFFRVRVSTLRRIVEFDPEERSIQARNDATQQLRTINHLTKTYQQEFQVAFEEIKSEMREEGIFLLDETELNDRQKEYIQTVYANNLSSSTYPLITSRGSQAKDLQDSSIYLAILLTPCEADQPHDFALIELPTKEFGRFITLPSESGTHSIIFLDDVIRFCLPMIFAGLNYERFDAYTFKFTRDAEIELYPGLDIDILEKISRGVKNRKKGAPVRFVYDREMPKELLHHIRSRLKIDRFDTSDAGSRYHNTKDLVHFPRCGRADLGFTPQPPISLPKFSVHESALDLIRERDYLLHYPYHSFSNYLRLLREAALSPDVESIKTTVYRLAKDSNVVKALICAAQHGKEVTVVVELLARFDESSNINWSKKMRNAGIHVIFGVEGLKVHSKLTHISSSKGDIACVSTGNFHEENARVYTDTTLLTADKTLTEEIDKVFSFIKQPFKKMAFHELIVSPRQMRKRIYDLIDKEIRNARSGKPAYILCKINHITDSEMIQKLYDASAAGVKMDFLVRGNCSIVPGEKGVSENISIRGIIDRYLEHSRIFIFGNRGREKYYMGSADWMTRNLDNRIEVYTPIHDPAIQAELKRIVEFGLRDNQAVRIVDGKGEDSIFSDTHPPFRSQQELYKHYLHSIQQETEKHQPILQV